MEIEKLIKQLKKASADGSWNTLADYANKAATALSTLQAENEKLRADLEYEREHANAYHEECGQWEAENEKLRAELERVKQERDAAVKCIEEIEDAFNFQRMSAIGLRISEWRGPQKED